MTSDLADLKRRQGAWAQGAGLVVDSDGYCTSLRDNLFLPLSPETHAEIEAGDGDELGEAGRRGKMQALHSSSALACNVFEYWRSRDHSPLAKALAVPELAAIRFEQKFPTGLGGVAPNLDVVLCQSDGGIVAIESKFGEPFRNSKAKNFLKPRYFTRGPLWRLSGLYGCQALADRLRTGDIAFQLLDAAQLLKHMLGLGQNGQSWRLLCLWYRPEGEAGDRHAAELAQFAQAIGPDDALFSSLTYQELFSSLEISAGASHGAYLSYLLRRYFPRRSLAVQSRGGRMGHTSEQIHIERRLVKVATGERSQTVNVCTGVNSPGTYEQVYRITKPAQFVSPSQLPRSLAELDTFLGARGATREGPRRR